MTRKPVKEIRYSPEELATIQELEGLSKNFHPAYAWTPFELEMLKQYYGKVPISKLERLLHHSTSSIKDKANAFGLHTERKLPGKGK